ncbi:MAG: TonB-dependent receptor, partial [Acidobacteria bacterium]|nr:TonB-dependent receptor [Acidobacteriota bacterium]
MAFIACLAIVWTVVAGPQVRTATGVVRDSSGAPISGALIGADPSGTGDVTVRTSSDGRFSLPISTADVVLIISAPGFRTVHRRLASSDPVLLEITLVATVAESVTVTAGRIEQRLTNVAATVSIVDRARLDRSPAMTTDDVLRQLPAFSLFRRSSSVAAHPTAQGVSLRGIGPSGVSRTLVLIDGSPFSDPFGGWVAWSRVPQASIERIEVVEGSGANLFGNYSMGGAINLVTRQPSAPWLAATLQYGQRVTPRFDGSAGFSRNGWTALVDAGTFSTDGYLVLPEEERGLVDENVSAESRRVYGSLGYRFAGSTSVQGRADIFDESRQNGKRSTIDRTPEQNHTTWSSFGLNVRMPRGVSETRASVFGDRVRFHSNFLAVPAATPVRSVGRMTLEQHVPSSSVGGAAQWTYAAPRASVFTAGIDWRRVEGDSEEEGLDPQTGTRAVLRRVSGGAQDNVGVFAQIVAAPIDPLVLTAAVRHDRWNNTRGYNLETDQNGQPTSNNRPTLPDRSDVVTTPRLSALFRATSSLSLWTAVGRGFRAPTLNELYRQFRVGAVTTLANENLGPERLRTVELGVRFVPVQALVLRAAWFDNRLRDAVSNVTVTVSGNVVTQQRQNLGLTRIRGTQVDLDWRPSARVNVSAGYLYNDAVVREFEVNPALVGRYLPQVPRHRATAQFNMLDERIGDLTVTFQAVGRQFDDDLNVRAVPGRTEAGLPAFSTVDVLLSRNVARGITAFAGAQNLLDQRGFTGTLPTTLG